MYTTIDFTYPDATPMCSDELANKLTRDEAGSLSLSEYTCALRTLLVQGRFHHQVVCAMPAQFKIAHRMLGFKTGRKRDPPTARGAMTRARKRLWTADPRPSVLFILLYPITAIKDTAATMKATLNDDGVLSVYQRHPSVSPSAFCKSDREEEFVRLLANEPCEVCVSSL